MFENRFRIKEFFLPYMVHLRTSCGSYNTRRLFRYTKLRHWCLLPRPGVFTARYELELNVVFFTLRSEASSCNPQVSAYQTVICGPLCCVFIPLDCEVISRSPSICMMLPQVSVFQCSFSSASALLLFFRRIKCEPIEDGVESIEGFCHCMFSHLTLWLWSWTFTV